MTPPPPPPRSTCRRKAAGPAALPPGSATECAQTEAHAIAPSRLKAVRRNLLRWFDRHKRELPWRSKVGRPDPYHVMVSEAMLQQTQVQTVIDYFHRFIAQWPDVRALAQADLQQVLTQWQGLGYYRRARHLHAAAQAIVQHHGGHIPRDATTLRQLPGVGPYTAGAIASLAFDQPEPLVDGNVARVLARYCGLAESIDQASGKATVWALAQELLSPTRPGAFNEAMMELGALICRPSTPSCHACPLSRSCRAHLQDRVDQLPVRRARRHPRPVVHHTVALHRKGRWLFVKRPGQGLWANMWAFPTAEHLGEAAPERADERVATDAVSTGAVSPPAVISDAVSTGAVSPPVQASPPPQLVDWVTALTGLATTDWQPIVSFTHITTHRRIRFHFWTCSASAGRLKPNVGVWRKLTDRALHDLPLANPIRRCVASLNAQARRKASS